MTRKDFITLLSPAIVFVLVAAAAFLISGTIARWHDDFDMQRADEKFRELSDKVRSGALRPTPDQMLDAIRRYRKVSQSQHELLGAVGRFVLSMAWFAPVGVCAQLSAILAVRKRWRKANLSRKSG
jgi:hypothetical protein